MNEYTPTPDNRLTFRARELARLAGTTVRTIHYYVAEGLLPPPEGERRNAIYTRAHLARLTIISALREEGLSLAAIRSRLDSLTDEGVLAVLETLDKYQDSAQAGEVTVLGLIEAAVADQTAESLNETYTEQEPEMSRPMLMSAPAPETDSARDYVERMLRRSGNAPTHRERPDRRPSPHIRPQAWYHFEIEDGIELRVREDRYHRRRIHRIVETVRHIGRRHGTREER